MSRPSAKEQERALQERANKWMHDLERAYVFLRSDAHKEKDDSKRDVAAIEALNEIREKLAV